MSTNKGRKRLKPNRFTRFNTDKLMHNTWLSLVRDFRSSNDHPDWHTAENALRRSVKDFRDFTFTSRFLSPYYFFKQEYQLESLFKRYRFQKDKYTTEQLVDMTLKKVVDTQNRLGAPRADMRFSTKVVIKKARSIVKSVLGRYDSEEHARLCSFGKRASVGHPMHSSYIECKLSDQITGSAEHIRWFTNAILPQDGVLRAIMDEVRIGEPDEQIPFVVCETLTGTTVPKSFKAFRFIQANTVLGGFYTSGIGEMIESRLSSVLNLHIPSLQAKHQRLAKKFSRTLTHATADLSSASDSFTSHLVNMLVPRDWYRALNLGRIRYSFIGGVRYNLATFMTMGIGYTFQLQTLLFYALLKAVQQITSTKGMVSVYGDDLIYPSSMHKAVTAVFTDANFILNEDKTFVKQSFRESCGGDYYCGIDVRPFQPEAEYVDGMTGIEYVTFCYKMVNGLLNRWCEEEIPSTLLYLYGEILRVDDTIKQIPPSYPDYSGVKVNRIHASTELIPWSPVGWNPMLQCARFEFYHQHVRGRLVSYQYPYYWVSLSGSNERQSFNPYHKLEDRQVLTWRSVRVQVKSNGKKIKVFRLVPYVAKKGCRPDIVLNTGSTSAWSEAS